MLADLLFEDVVESREDIFKKYPRRKLEKEQLVLRFAPSPTGYLHIGNVYTALAGYILTKNSNGVFILRIEDTDKEREIEEGIVQIVDGLKYFGIEFDEGVLGKGKTEGIYGPYIQSERVEIYRVFAKDLVSKGLTYPCFATEQELEEIRKQQEKKRERTGYYGKWAKWRDASLDSIEKELEKETPYVIRLYSRGDFKKKIECTDLIKGRVTLSQNDMDSILLKSDGYPTYHFAHPIDDTLMDISYVLRGDEWLSSQPLHMEIFEALKFKQLDYGHISPLMKKEGEGKRKLSKRRDPESRVAFYIENGYPVEGVKEYLLNVANSNFSDWRRLNPDSDILEFNLRLEKFNKAGALFDILKINNICKEYISTLSAQQVYNYALEWSEKYSEQTFSKLSNHREYCINILNIEREGERIRKDIVKWSDVLTQLEIFFDDLFVSMKKDVVEMEDNLQRAILNMFLDTYYFEDSSSEWFNKIKEIALRNNFSTDSTEYIKDPSKYRGRIGDVAMVIRVAATGRRQTPDLYQVMQVMGEVRVRERLQGYINDVLM